MFSCNHQDTLEMASEIYMSDPVCLIENSGEQLVVNREALEILSAIENPVVVVAIVGLSHTGKSYLMNKLAGKQNGECYQQSSAQSSSHVYCQHSASKREEKSSETQVIWDALCPSADLLF